jgi:hypothetical protein
LFEGYVLLLSSNVNLQEGDMLLWVLVALGVVELLISIVILVLLGLLSVEVSANHAEMKKRLGEVRAEQIWRGS